MNLYSLGKIQIESFFQTCPGSLVVSWQLSHHQKAKNSAIVQGHLQLFQVSIHEMKHLQITLMVFPDYQVLCYMLNTGSASTLVKTQPFLHKNMSKFALIQFCSIIFPSTAVFSHSNVTDIMQFIEPHELFTVIPL